MSKKYHVRERSFLNKKTDMRAYVMAIVEDTRDMADCFEDGWRWGEIELKLADCFDEVSFEFNLSTREERETACSRSERSPKLSTLFLKRWKSRPATSKLARR